MFLKIDLFLSHQSEKREIPTLLGPLQRANLNHWRLALSKAPNRVSPSPHLETETFRNIVFFSSLEFHKASDSECYTPLSETFKLY
jgi:hypothetical protein